MPLTMGSSQHRDRALSGHELVSNVTKRPNWELVDPLFLARFGPPVRRTTRDAQRGSTKAYVPLTMGSSHNRKGRKRPWASPKLDQATKLVGKLGTGNWELAPWVRHNTAIGR